MRLQELVGRRLNVSKLSCILSRNYGFWAGWSLGKCFVFSFVWWLRHYIYISFLGVDVRPLIFPTDRNILLGLVSDKGLLCSNSLVGLWFLGWVGPPVALAFHWVRHSFLPRLVFISGGVLEGVLVNLILRWLLHANVALLIQTAFVHVSEDLNFLRVLQSTFGRTPPLWGFWLSLGCWNFAVSYFRAHLRDWVYGVVVFGRLGVGLIYRLFCFPAYHVLRVTVRNRLNFLVGYEFASLLEVIQLLLSLSLLINNHAIGMGDALRSNMLGCSSDNRHIVWRGISIERLSVLVRKHLLWLLIERLDIDWVEIASQSWSSWIIIIG